MIRHFVLLVFIFFSCFALADANEGYDDLPTRFDGDCRLVWNPEVENWYITCYIGGKTNQQNFGCMSKENCEAILDQILAAINRAISACGAAKDAVDQSFTELENANIPNIVITITGIVNQYRSEIGEQNADNVLGLLYNLSVAHTNIINRLENAHNQCVGAEAECMAARDSLAGIDCDSGGSGSGSSSGNCGSGDCPCSDEFDDVVRQLNGIDNSLLTLIEDVSFIRSSTYLIRQSVTNIADNVQSMVDRLNSPDDRMWGEIQNMYSNIIWSVSTITNRTVDWMGIFYSIRELLRDTDNPLRLSTEGVISLYQAAFQAQSQALQIQSLSDFGHAVKYFSNTVSMLFHQYSELTFGKSNILPSSDQYITIYNVFTNDSLHARGRYSWLTQLRQAGITNWFQRMEFYQQAKLGWFNELSTPMDEEQENLTESNLEQQMLNTTNSLGAIVSASGGVSNSIESVFNPVSQAFDGVEIQASMPTLITFLPEIEIGDFGELGPIQLDTTEIQDYCDVARRVTTLVWRILIWSLYVGLAVAVGRLLFILVLYLIHFIQNL